MRLILPSGFLPRLSVEHPGCLSAIDPPEGCLKEREGDVWRGIARLQHGGTAAVAVHQPLRQEPPRSNQQSYPPARNQTASSDAPASPKQISYLLSLASKRGITPSQIAAQQNVANIDQLSRRLCSALIEQWRAA